MRPLHHLTQLASTATALQGSPPLPQHLQAIENELRHAHTPGLNKEMNALFKPCRMKLVQSPRASSRVPYRRTSGTAHCCATALTRDGGA